MGGAGEGAEGKSQMSRTQGSVFWGNRGQPSKSVMYAGGGTFYDFNAVG